MKNFKINLQQFKGAEVLTISQMKKVLGGFEAPVGGCGTGISCKGKKGGDSCGTKTCVCDGYNGDATLYCTSQV